MVHEFPYLNVSTTHGLLSHCGVNRYYSVCVCMCVCVCVCVYVCVCVCLCV